MSETTIADIKRILRSAPPSGLGLILIGTASTDHMSETDAQAFIDAMEDYFEERVGFVPSTTSKLVIEIIANLSAYHIYTKLITSMEGMEIPENVKGWKDWAEEMIQKIVDGEIELASLREPFTEAAPTSSEFAEIRGEQIALDGTDYIDLDHQHILKYSEQVWADEDRTTKLTRDTDYKIFYQTGEMQRIEGGAIGDGDTVYVDYLHQKVKPFERKEGTVEWRPIEGYREDYES